jgi:hypothetical protein
LIVPDVDFQEKEWFGFPASGLGSLRRLRESVFDPNRFTSISAPQEPEIRGQHVEGRQRVFEVEAPQEGLEAKLFKNSVSLKVLTSQLAMHLTRDERRIVFAALDRLLNPKDWEEGESSEIDEHSFSTLLRFLVFAHPKRPANLGVGPEGVVLAGWRRDDKVIHVEFHRNDQCVTLLRFETDRGAERIAWRGHVTHLRDIAKNNGLASCLD